MFSEYCKDTYGLTENDIKYVWNEYKNIILYKINNMGNINESVDKISRVDYLNKIVEYLVDDTIINFNENKIRLPFTLSPFLLLHHHPSFFSSLISTSLFSKYCKDNYGLTDEEIDYVWKEYRNIIFDKINNMGSINESIDRRDEYLNKIVDFLVDDTEMVYDIKVIRYPHLPNHPQFFSFSRFFLFNSRPSFSKYIKDNYSLNDEEIDYVWEEYKNIINEKTKP